MAVRLIHSLSTSKAFADLFSDDSLLQSMLQFETALAAVQAALKIIPTDAAAAIGRAAAQASAFDVDRLAEAALHTGTLSIPVVQALTEQVRAQDAKAAGFVHWGATSQDLADTALVLLLRRAQPILQADLDRLESALQRLSEGHKTTVMLGRTLLQGAPPVTFGLKAAGWVSAIHRCRRRLDSAFAEALLVQLGGAVGTTAALGERGPEVGRALAKELGLRYPGAPWHTQRDRLAALVCACGILTGSLGKMARDVSLLMQGEIAEVAEPSSPGRGGSSTMPQKRNPVGATVALAAAQRVPGLVATFLSAMVQEHERAVGGWQAEWPTISAVLQATGVALASMAETAGGLEVDQQKMRANLDATRGAIYSEKAMMLLADSLGRDAAHKLLAEASRRGAVEGKHLAEVLAELPEVAGRPEGAGFRGLEIPENYLGSAEEYRKDLLGSPAEKTSTQNKE
jgi:3-carboxy-cis,cis-muconate cycloisomerase